MKKENDIASLFIRDEHRFLGIVKPRHPLISVLRFDGMMTQDKFPQRFIFDLYSVSIKKNVDGEIRYSQRHFDSGIMTFMSSNQFIARSVESDSYSAGEGICLNVHPDFFSGYPLTKTIREYGFFSYEINEASHLSEQEEEAVLSIMNR